jgi:hypothetical protein
MKPIFIIAHKYFRGYESYTEYYIQNIKNFFNKISSYNLILLDNNIESKFEIGAYTVGLKYIIDNNLSDEYSYVFFTQDNFVIKNKVDLNKLLNDNVFSCPIVGCERNPNSKEYLGIHDDAQDVVIPILSSLNLYNNMDKISFCWCNSFLAHSSKINQLYNFFKNISIINRWQSVGSERFLARIIYELNNQSNYSLDGDIRELKNYYNMHNSDINMKVSTYFQKICQGKNENTIDRT